jgi:RNA polymerase sigma-70 factor, ECF subfamily
VRGVTDETAAATTADDALLLQRLRDRDEQAFDEIVRKWSPPMLRVARGFVSTDASAQEVVQEAWLGVIHGLATFEGRSSLRTWAFRIVVNIAKTRGVKEQRSTPMSSLTPEQESGPTVDPSRFRPADAEQWPRNWAPHGVPQRWDADPVAGVLRSETRTLVSAALDGLPERQRAVLVMRDVEGFDSDEVCELLGLTAENQRVLLHRGRAKIRAALEDYYTAGSR